LSRGQRSALGITIGLAARAEVTLFDEPCAGLDAVARRIFYDRPLAEYADMPRTVVLSRQANTSASVTPAGRCSC
jgi:ABC-2 type transport system ATP-binding protein